MRTSGALIGGKRLCFLDGPMTDTCSATQVKRDSESTVSEAMVPERPKAISFLKALLLPGVIAVSAWSLEETVPRICPLRFSMR